MNLGIAARRLASGQVAHDEKLLMYYDVASMRVGERDVVIMRHQRSLPG